MQTNQWIDGAQRAECHRPFSNALRRALALLMFAITAWPLAPARAASDAPSLFVEEITSANKSTIAAAPPRGYKRARLAKLNAKLLADQFSPLRQERKVAADAANLTLNLFADRALPVAITHTEFKGEGRFIAHGVVVGKPQSMVLLAVNDGVVAGSISVLGEPMTKISPAGDLTQVGEIAADELPGCGTQEIVLPVIRPGDVIPATAGDATVVDVMIVYTAAARAGAGSVAAINAAIDLAIAEANTSYSNSAVSVTLNLVYRGEIAYTESGNANTDLTRAQSGSSGLSSLLTLRTLYGADVVTLVTETMASYAGLGYVMSPVSSGFAPYAFNVVKREYLYGSYVYAHEVGHNMGCMHDRANSTSAGAFNYSYGHRFDVSSTTYRTVMAYAPGARIPYFSNPDVNYGGVPTGIAAGATNSANNALSLSNSVPTVASFSSSSSSFNFEETTVTANENGSTVTLTVTLSGPAASTNVTVAYTTAAVTATAGSDYTTAAGTFTFATNETSKTITVTLLNDTSVEVNETFKVNLSSPAGGPVLGPDRSATITIVDNDIGITMAAGTASVSEGGTSLELTVTRSGGLTNTVTVDYATVDASAAAGSDFTAATGTLTFTNGVTNQTITVAIADDSAIETNETFKVNLSSPSSGVTLVAPTNTTVTIIENDSLLAFSTNAVAIAENGTMTLTVTRTGGTAGTVTVDYLTVDGAAAAGTDFTNTTGTLTFTNGVASRTITVPLTNDSSVEGNETFNVALTNATAGATLGAYSNLVATIRDNDSVIAFSTNAVSVAENNGPGVLTLTRTGGTIGAATVHYATTNGSAVGGSDFTSLNGTLSFAAGETTKTISLALINNTTPETNETLTVVLTAPTGEATLGTNDTVTVTITDNDSLIGFAASTLSVDEASTNISLTIARTGTLTLTNTIAFAFKAASATSADFRGTNGVLTFAPGDTNKTITFGVIDDSVVEANETFQIILSAATGGALITGTNTATVTIAETDIGLTFAASAYTTAEDGGSVILTVNRSGATNGTATVDFATADVSALSTTDYTNTNGTLTFTNGVASQTITVPLVDDSDIETNETFKVTLSGVSNGIIVGSTNAVVTILEDDASIALSTNAVSVSEVATNVTLTVTRTGGTNTTMSVDYATADASATNATDYTSTTGTLSFTPGQKSKTITVPLLADSSVEGNETFTLALSNVTGGGGLGATTNVTVTILDNDSVVSFSTNAVAVTETQGTISLTVTRTGGAVGAATVHYATASGTATSAVDFTALNGTLTFAAGETSKIIPVSVLNDTTLETNETFTVVLSAPTGESTLGSNDTVTITISDNDSLIGFQASTLSADEVSTNLTLTVVRSGTLTLTNTIAFSFKSGSATAADFRGTNSVLTFAPGETNKTITFGVIDDSLVETNESFQVILASPTGGAAITGTNAATVTIIETDIGLAFSPATYSVPEGGSALVLTVARTGATNGTATIDFATADVSAAAGTDFTNTNGTLTFTNGVASQTISVPIIEDAEVETNETFKVVLSGASANTYVIGSTNSVVTILENDGMIALSTNAVSVSEIATNITLTVTRTGGTNTSMTVDYFTTDATATDGADYTSAIGTLTFAPGQKSKTISVPLANDTTVEGNETFSLTLTNVTGGASLGSTTNVVVTIQDNDSVFAVSTNALTAVETAGTATITVVRTGGLVGVATVAYATGNGIATAGSDYTAATGTLSFAAGETNKLVVVKITNDASYETDETFQLALSGPTGEGVLSTNATVTVTITDNDSTISFGTNALSVAESAGTVSISVARTGTLGLTNTIPYSFKAGSATTADYTATNGVLIFAPGETNKTVVAAITNDSLIETNETFTITLGTPTGGAVIGGTNIATITIAENDVGISFLASTVSVWENADDVTLTILRSGDTTATVTVDYATADGTATVSNDYTNTNGTLTFTNGVTSLTVTIPIVEDATIESDEKFALTLSSPSGAVISGTNTAQVTIREDNAGFKLSATAYSGREGTNAIVTLTRVGNTNTTFDATLVTAYTGAATNTDFAAINTNVTFATGQVSLTVTVPLTKDAIVDTNETFDVQIATATVGYDAVAPTNAVVTIIDNTGSLQFLTNAVAVVESATNVLVTVTRTGGTNNTLTIDYVTADGAATAGVDYTGLTNTLSFAAGQASKTISVPLTNDSSIEGDESFTLALSNPDGAVLGAVTSATVTIRDNDSVIMLSTNAVSIAESGAKLSVSVTRTGGLAAAASVSYRTSTNSVAVAGSDFTAQAGVLTFAAGETNKTLSVGIINDTAYETNESFSVTLSSPTADATLGTNDTVTITITDNDSTLAWNTNAVSVAENAGAVTLTVDRTGTLTLTNTVAFSFKTGTAGSTDYTATNGVLTFAPSETNKTITVGIVNDSLVESPEIFTVTLSAPTGGALLGGTNLATVTIADNDVGVGFATATRSVSEDATNLILTVTRSGDTNGTISVDYTFADLTATNSVDYLGTNGSLSFTNGVTSLTIDVPIENDTAVESNETFKLTLSNATGGIVTGNTNTTVTIIEDDSSIAFTTNAVSAIETATSISLTVKRTGGTNSTVTVDFLTIDGAATAGADYTSTNATLTFSPGQITKTVSVPLANDSSVEGNETFTLSLTNASGTAVILGSYTNATVTIQDNDSVIVVSTNAISVAENVGNATIVVTRAGGVVGTSTVAYTAAASSATSPADFTAATGVVTFKPGETNKTISVKITNDTGSETDETFTVTLASPTGEATLGGTTATTVTIVDNDFGVGDTAGSVAPIAILSLHWNEELLPTLTIGGPLGAYVVVDGSSDLENWEPLDEQRIQSGTVQVIDANAGSGNRFYRLRAPDGE